MAASILCVGVQLLAIFQFFLTDHILLVTTYSTLLLQRSNSFFYV